MSKATHVAPIFTLAQAEALAYYAQCGVDMFEGEAKTPRDVSACERAIATLKQFTDEAKCRPY